MKYPKFLCRLKSLKALYNFQRNPLCGLIFPVDLCPTHTQHFLPRPVLQWLPVSAQPFPLLPPIQKQATHNSPSTSTPRTSGGAYHSSPCTVRIVVLIRLTAEVTQRVLPLPLDHKTNCCLWLYPMPSSKMILC